MALGLGEEITNGLARVRSADREEALAALQEVRARVWKEGTIYEPAPLVVPSLIELAGAPEVLVRPPVLQLLAFLFTGEAAPETGHQPWVDATRTAVRLGLHAFLALFDDEDRDVRIAAACLVVGFRDRDAEPDIRRALTRRFGEEQDEVVKANLIGCLNVYIPSSHFEVYDVALTDASLLVRREAAHSLAAVMRDETPTLVVATLLEAMIQGAELAPLYAGVAWNQRGVVADSCWALTRLGEAARPYLRHLEKVLKRVDAQDALSVAEAALLIAFGGPAASRSRADLGPEHLSLLRAIAQTDAIWGQELPQMMAHYGLPRSQATLTALLERS